MLVINLKRKDVLTKSLYYECGKMRWHQPKYTIILLDKVRFRFYNPSEWRHTYTTLFIKNSTEYPSACWRDESGLVRTLVRGRKMPPSLLGGYSLKINSQ